MWGILGDLTFELLDAPEKLEERERFIYAEHKVLKGKAKLQAMGSALKEITLRVKPVNNPEEFLQKLQEMALSMKAYDFILGNGKWLGTYVIKEIKKVWKETDKDGNLLEVEVEVVLKETENE